MQKYFLKQSKFQQFKSKDFIIALCSLLLYCFTLLISLAQIYINSLKPPYIVLKLV